MTRRPRTSQPLRFTRRNLLRGSLAATAAIPLLNAQRVVGQDEPIRRLIVVSYPNGTRGSMFWPSGTETDFQLNTFTAPLEPYKDKLVFLKGIRLNDSLQNGALGGTLGSEHARGTGGMLTARPLNSGSEFESFGNTTSGWGSGQSIDQLIADRIGSDNRFSSLQLGVHVRDNEVRARISYRDSNQPVPPREDPAEVFDTLFGATDGARLRAQRQSVFDMSYAETERLAGIVGAEDKAKLDAHLTSMRQIEERLVSAEGAGSSCVAPALQDVDTSQDSQYQEAGRLQMDLAVAALACDQTRVVTLQWSYSESEHLFQFLQAGGRAIDGNHHGISHDFSSSGANFDAYNTIQTWYHEQLAYLLGKLASYQEGSATLLDNTLVLWGTEIGESTTHALTTMPYLLAGGAGGRIQTGRFIDYGGNEQDNNQMLVSIAHALGVDDLTSFGDPSGTPGPLPSLA
ncbi:MAG TPA: DUF1552 domain-containing protein [Polyangiaceae bacterium]